MKVERYKVSNRLLIMGADAPEQFDLRNRHVVLAEDYEKLAEALRDANTVVLSTCGYPLTTLLHEHRRKKFKYSANVIRSALTPSEKP